MTERILNVGFELRRGNFKTFWNKDRIVSVTEFAGLFKSDRTRPDARETPFTLVAD